MEKKAAIYSRVSADDKTDQDNSLASQVEACKRYAENLGYSVVAEFSEDISDTTPMMQRPRGSILNYIIGMRNVDAVIVHGLDRLSRDIVDLLVTVRSWLEMGIEIYAGDIGRIDSESDILLSIQGWHATDECKKIKERTMRGKYTKARSGLVIGARPPFGYHHLRDSKGKILNFEIIDEQARIVRLIYEWYTEGDEAGQRLSVRAIAVKLSAMRIPSPGEQKGNYPAKVGNAGTWHPNTIVRILSQEAYAGVWHYGKNISHTGVIRPVNEWVDIAVPAIIDRITWEKAQELKPENRRLAIRNLKHDYLLRGMIRCGKCGDALSGGFSRNLRHYHCSHNRKNHSNPNEDRCTQGLVKAGAIEADIWCGIIDLFKNIPQLEQLLRKAQQEEFERMNAKKSEIKALEGIILDAENEARVIAKTICQTRSIIAKTLEDDQNKLVLRYETMIAKRDKLVRELTKVRLTDQAVTSLLGLAGDVRVEFDNLDYNKARRILESLNVNVVVRDQHYWVKCLAGKWDGEVRN